MEDSAYQYSTQGKMKISPVMETKVGFRPPLKTLTGDEIIDAFNLEANEIIQNINMNNEDTQYKSPFLT